jgi:hypothetical protein
VRAAELAKQIPSAKRRGDSEWYDARCPAHDDTRPSFSFRDNEEKRRIDMVCRRQCPRPAIAAALGLAMADFFFDPIGGANGAGPVPTGPQVVAEYPYHNAAGELVRVVERLEPKSFRQKRPDGRGGWSWNLGDTPRVLYRLPGLQGQARVYVVEGEKDADRLANLGLTATCNAMGAGKWTETYTAQLVAAGVREVVVLQDNDTAGVAHARDVARSCQVAGLDVKMPRLPGWPPVRDKKGEDVSDWLDAEHTVDELATLVDQTVPETAATLAPLDASAPPADGVHDAKANIWNKAKSAGELIAAGGATVDWIDYPIAARGSITQINAPRGTGKTAVVLARIVTLARRGVRVLYLDRDNSPSSLRKRLVGVGAGTEPTLKVLTREEAPSFADAAAWRAFPLEDFDVVVIDSWDTFAEGAGEQDSRRATLALAPLLDMVRREHAPAVILLCNVTKDGAAGRGAGPIEDRADNVFEARDATGFTPSGKRPWWEELPSAARSEWASRATRRSGPERPERIRLALVSTKFRDDDDPAPAVHELDFTATPWSLRDVTAELVVAGDDARAAEVATAKALEEQAVDALVDVMTRRQAEGGRLLLTESVRQLVGHGIGRRRARELVKAGGDRWRLVAVDGRSEAIVPFAPSNSGEPSARFEQSETAHKQRGSLEPHRAASMDTGRQDSASPIPAIHAAPKHAQISPLSLDVSAPARAGEILAGLPEEGVV